MDYITHVIESGDDGEYRLALVVDPAAAYDMPARIDLGDYNRWLTADELRDLRSAINDALGESEAVNPAALDNDQIPTPRLDARMARGSRFVDTPTFTARQVRALLAEGIR